MGRGFWSMIWVVLCAALVTSACGSDTPEIVDGDAAPATTAVESVNGDLPEVSSLTPPTTGVFGNTLTRPTDLESLDFTGFEVGEVRTIDWTFGCGSFGLYEGPGQRYLQDRPIVSSSSGDGLVRSDFPPDWGVFIYNETPHDGSEFVLLDVVVTRVDEDTIEMRASNDGPLIANFLRDKTDPAEWESC